MKKQALYRSAKSGRFTSKTNTKRNPSTTVREIRARKGAKSKKRR